MADGFLGRWSQRKQALREGRVVAEPAAPPSPNTTPATPEAGSEAEKSTPASAASQPAPLAARTTPVPPQAPPPTLEDVKALNAQSSYAPFVSRGVAPEVRNAAMKKLFADPHYNVMDGLDIYIDDYSLPSPMPAAMLRQMASAKFLKLFDEEDQAAPAAAAAAPASSADPALAPAAPHTPATQDPHHDHTDLRLQPDPAARPACLEREPERAADPAFEPVPPPGR